MKKYGEPQVPLLPLESKAKNFDSNESNESIARRNDHENEEAHIQRSRL